MFEKAHYQLQLRQCKYPSKESEYYWSVMKLRVLMLSSQFRVPALPWRWVCCLVFGLRTTWPGFAFAFGLFFFFKNFLGTKGLQVQRVVLTFHNGKKEGDRGILKKNCLTGEKTMEGRKGNFSGGEDERKLNHWSKGSMNQNKEKTKSKM